MKILILSDSHGNAEGIIDAVESDEFDKIIFVGDGLKDILQLQLPKEKLILVKGNNDITKKIPSETLVEIEGRRIFITHGNDYGVKMGLKKLIDRAIQLDADVVIFGHTHIPIQTQLDNGIVCINPGSISRSRVFQKTFVVLSIDKEKDIFSSKLIEIE